MTTPRPFLAALIFATVTPCALAAQARGSQPTLVFGIAAGVTGSRNLWSVAAQPVGTLVPPDTLKLNRTLDAGVGLAIYGMYFPKSAVGFSGEMFFVGNSYDDSCETSFTTGTDPVFADTCRLLDGSSHSSTTVIANGGVTLRAFPRRTVSPYVRLSAGFSYTSRSSTRLGTNDVAVYETKGGSSLHPSVIGGIGFSARSGSGDLQIRMELRDALVGYSVVTGPAPYGSVAPPTESRYMHLVSLLLGIDLVLEQSRGRRY